MGMQLVPSDNPAENTLEINQLSGVS
jgi:hypothetical protein